MGAGGAFALGHGHENGPGVGNRVGPPERLRARAGHRRAECRRAAFLGPARFQPDFLNESPNWTRFFFIIFSVY